MIYDCKTPSWVVEVGEWFNANLISSETIMNFLDYITETGLIKCIEVSGII